MENEFKGTKTNVYGVEMTGIQEMKFSKYLNNSEAPAPNTLTVEQRYELANNWLIKEATTI